MFLGEIFQTQTMDGWPDLTQPEPQKIDPTQPTPKFFAHTHHYRQVIVREQK